ncbi:unnamed protein product [Diamesa hyperborea]
MSKNIFCNSCFEDKEDSSRIFFCTSCSHIFCSTCLNNYESFCLICKVKCKVLEINEDLPADVKLIFDETCFEKCIENAARAFSFQENQARFYTHSLKVRVCKYQRIKKDLLKFKQLSIDITKTIRKEKALMEKLKFAYRSGQITPDLFTGSQNTSEFIPNESERAKSTTSSNESSTKSPFFSSGAASQSLSSDSDNSGHSSKNSFDCTPSRASSVFRNSFGSSSSGNQSSNSQQKNTLSSSMSSIDKVNRPFVPPISRQSSDSQTSTYSRVISQRNLFMKTREDVLENTLRHMQIISQDNYKKNHKK